MGQDPGIAADKRYAAPHLPKVIDGVEVKHLSCGDIARLADEAYPLCPTDEQKM